MSSTKPDRIVYVSHLKLQRLVDMFGPRAALTGSSTGDSDAVIRHLIEGEFKSVEIYDDGERRGIIINVWEST